MHANTYETCIHNYTCTYIKKYISLLIHTSTYTHTYTYTHINMHAYINTCITCRGWVESAYLRPQAWHRRCVPRKEKRQPQNIITRQQQFIKASLGRHMQRHSLRVW